MNYRNEAKKVIDTEIDALMILRDNLDEAFDNILELVVNCHGKVVVCGMGKSGHIARKISATMASLGTPSFFLHPAEAMHGDMGMVSNDDLVLLISHSGESNEIINVIQPLKTIGTKIVGITAKADSTLALESDYVYIMPDVQEAGSLNLAPTSSTTAVLAFGDALAVVASNVYGFTKDDFGLFHPGGTLGKNILIRVNDIMAKDSGIPIVKTGASISEAIMEMSKKTLGMVLIVDDDDKLVGLLTDGDLRRAIEKKVDLYNDLIDEIMTVNPKCIKGNILAVKALQQLKENSINNYPVVNENNEVVGAITWQMIVKAGIMI